jgi:hypothetical protein
MYHDSKKELLISPFTTFFSCSVCFSRPLSAADGELINPYPSLRSLDKFLQSRFIQNNPLVECLLFLEQIQVRFFLHRLFNK